MDLNEIFLFTQVVRSGSFTQAAKALGVPKSKVSRKVQELERRLGVTLLQRTTRSLSLTEPGQEYFQRCAQALDEISEAENQATQAQHGLRGTIRVTTSVSAGMGFFGRLACEFMRQHSELKLEVILTDAIVDLVKDRFDLAIRMGELKDSTLLARKVGMTEMRLFASPSYVAKRGNPKSPQDLASHSCLDFIRETGRTPWVLRSEKVAQRIKIEPSFSSNSLLLLHQLALAGDGIVYLPTYLCGEDVQSKRLVQVLEKWRYQAGPIHFVYPNREFVPKRVQVFTEFLTPRLKAFF